MAMVSHFRGSNASAGYGDIRIKFAWRLIRRLVAAYSFWEFRDSHPAIIAFDALTGPSPSR
jgi:hypothetical protein